MGGGGGVVTSIECRTLEKKTRVKSVSKSMVGAERENCVKTQKWEKRGKGYPNRYDQNSSRAIKRGKGR